ncbi:MAG TPA: SUMF1/EgtB/PvdO family nonheme iron enzyme [Planctomycetota bacterium]|nr:SUMF1/EgtB/PvdO family nonheme iron enzyme [Planctomycetota bacterium]
MPARLTVSGSLLLLAASVLAADPPYYVKKGTWQETMLASREALLKHEADQTAKPSVEPSAKPVPKPSAGVELGTWYLVGPFYPPNNQKNFTMAFPPEKEAALSKHDDLSAVLDGAEGGKPAWQEAMTKSYGKLRWQACPQFQDGVPHDMSAGTNGSTYLYRMIKAPRDMTITGYFGSDDGMRAWLNGKLLISNDTPRGHAPNQDTAKLELKKGENHLLLKIHNNSGGHGFYFHTSPTPVAGAVASRKRDPKQIARDELWSLVSRDFRDGSAGREMSWERQDNLWAADWTPGDLAALAKRYVAATRMPSMAKEAAAAAGDVKAPADLARVREPYYRSLRVEEASALVKNFNFKALRLAIEDLADTYPTQYTKGKEFLQRLEALEKAVVEVAEAKGDPGNVKKLADVGDEIRTLRTEALLTHNPLIDFDKLLVVKRSARNLGLPQNWVTNASIASKGYDNEIAVLSPVRPGAQLTTLYRPANGEFVGDVDLHWDGDRMIFSSIGANGRWQVFEIKADGSGLRQVNPGLEPDVDNFDPCYLPDGRILFTSTRAFHGVPCVGGGSPVANIVLLDPKTGKERELCFDQDQNWCPTVLNNGRVLYTRWEYSDTPHYFSRLLFHMNPDGTEQMEFAFSNSYWPNSTFYARPVPGHPTKVVAIISGHHGVPRMGQLLVYDPAKGRHEDDGAVQLIPSNSTPTVATITDGLANPAWPKFLHPYPLSDKYILVSCQMNAQSPWALCLVDTFDNILPILEVPGYAILEPVPLRKTAKPPVVPDKVDLSKDYATVYLNDVYFGEGLKGVPRGTVKKLRLLEPHYGYNGMGGHIHIGIDGPWDVHRIHGTVPVNPDGSALFKVPANLPIAVQPLDAEGKAVQVMRSWYTAMPGEAASCVGCHERQNTTPSLRRTIAATQKPSEIEPWRGAARGFSFLREVQPVLDKHCVGCHDGKPRQDGKTLPCFADTGKGDRGFAKSYLALHPYVRRPGPESDYHLQVPMEWDASTSELVQMLKKGHNGVKLDAEAWDRLYTWIDLNVPCHGTWTEHRGNIEKIVQRRLEMRTKYANRPENPEVYPTPPPERPAFVKPEPPPERKPFAEKVAGWPFDAAEAKKRQEAAGLPAELKIALADNLALDLVLVPAGEFVMGSADGYPDEYPQCRVKVDKPFYMGKCEITNEQYALFDAAHDSAYISVFNKDHSNRGQAVNRDKQPVLRISWKQAMDFCYWLSQKTDRKFALPTEAQWEWAARAGTDTPLYWGDCTADFGKLANLADKRLTELCIRDSPKWIPCIAGVNDGSIVPDNVGKYTPNAFGLLDMAGNVAEWTLTAYKPYPYVEADGRNAPSDSGRKVARGGSYYDRPFRARSAVRYDYASWQCVHNVGFRIICDADGKKVASADAK